MKKILLTLTILIAFAGSAFALPYIAADGHIDNFFYGNEFSGISSGNNFYSSDVYSIGAAKPGIKEWYQHKDGTSIFTYWSGLSVEYTTELSEGLWNIGINVANHVENNMAGIGDGWYLAFEIDALLNNGVEEQAKVLIQIDASDTETQNGYFTENLNAGTYTIRYTWMNDQYNPNATLDANLKIQSAFFDKVSPVIPEPTTMALLGLSSLGLLSFKRKK